MPRFKAILIIAAFLQLTVNAQFALPDGRELFNDGWKFIRYFNANGETGSINAEPSGLHLAAADDSKWQDVLLPHDWAIYGPFNDTLENNTGLLPWKGIGWYRKHFRVENSDKGKKVYIDFDGAMANSKVWINGRYVGGWPYGYTSFRLDITDALKHGEENVIAVRLDTKSWDSRWYPGAGIYRNVWLVKKDKMHFSHNGIILTTPVVNPEKVSMSISAEIENHSGEYSEAMLKFRVYRSDNKGKHVGEVVSESAPIKAGILPGSPKKIRADLSLTDPELWDTENPALYIVVAELVKDGKITESETLVTGFRNVDITPRDGLYLNGKKVFLKGVNMHHDLGALGAAFNLRAAERQLEILKEMGCNAIRTSHNPPAPEILMLCDRMGIMVQVEAFDAWRKGKKPNDYNKLFDSWHEEDLRAMVRRDRNHPSVIMWSIGNEVPDQGNYALAKSLVDIVKSEDPTRPVTAGCDNPESGTNGFQKALNIFGINYRLGVYGRYFDHPDNALRPFHATESASTVSSRGEYFFPVVTGDLDNNLPGKGICHVSSYDLSYPWWASTPDQQWEMNDKYPGVFGEFVWTGFDYLGEPTPFFHDITDMKKAKDEKTRENIRSYLEKVGTDEIPSRSSYFGILDIAGFKKDRFWLYQSKWRPEIPSAHILPHWNWPERKGLVTPVHVYTSGDEAELFLNGKSQGRKKRVEFTYRFAWDNIVYQPGELKVITYKNGEKWAEDVVKTTGKPSRLTIGADRKTVTSDGYDLVFVTVTITDKNGLQVPRAANKIKFTITGPGEIVATDNGDPTSHELFQLPVKSAYNGLCLAIVRAKKGTEGKITVKAESEGVTSAFAEFEAVK